MDDMTMPGPSDEPPPTVSAELLWRVAVRLLRDHPDASVRPDGGRPLCARCDQPWPCSGRRLAQLGLDRAASRTGQPP
jgi:hypothetical protein